MDRDGIDNFEKNATDVIQGIKKIEIKDESDQGWKAEWVEVNFINNNVDECETADLEFDVRYYSCARNLTGNVLGRLLG